MPDPTPAPAAVQPPVQSQATPVDDPNEMVSVFNQSPKFGDIVHDEYEDVLDPTTKRFLHRKLKVRYKSQAGKFAKVPRYVAELWKSQMPTRIVDPDEVGAPGDHDPASAKVSRLERENTDLKKRLENLEALVAQLPKKK